MPRSQSALARSTSLGARPFIFALASLVATPAFAGGEGEDEEPAAEASGSVSLSADGAKAEAEGDAAADTEAETEIYDPKRAHIPWFKRWAPEDRMAEIGVFGGVMLVADDHEIYGFDPDQPDGAWKPIDKVQPDIGARLGFYPIRHFGVEAEFAGIPMSSSAYDGRAFGFAIRGSVVGQVGLWNLTPFIIAGAGTLAVSSDADKLGGDQDEVFHVGAGIKFFMSRYVGLRFEFRNLFTSNRGADNKAGTSHQELLLGLAFTLGRDKNEAPPPPPDEDGDGVLDDVDECPKTPGSPDYAGCPVPDTDGDGVKDDVDECKNEAGSPDYAGCPVPDTDGDGIKDDVDACKDEAGVAEYDGCPVPDSDGDGVIDTLDKCVDEPETANSYMDEDGCPDEIPEAVRVFVGVIEGINFDTGKATIRKSSRKQLDKAVALLKEYPQIRLEISGHTDDQGTREDNLALSSARAASVKTYMVDAGVDSGRIETVGFGPDKPIEANDTKKGRQANRRIEFRLLKEGEKAEEVKTMQMAPIAAPADEAPADEAKADEAKADDAKADEAKADDAN